MRFGWGTMSRSDVAEQYLESLGTILWGRAYDILEVESRQQCVAQLVALWQSLEDLERSLEHEARDGVD